MVFMMASMGLPGTSGFVGEFLVIIGSFQISFWLALLGGMGMILGAAYMLYLYRRVIFGRLTKQDLRNILDLSPREWALFAPLIVLTLWMGVYPSSFSSFWDASVAAIVKQHTAALASPAGNAATANASTPHVMAAASTPHVMAGEGRPSTTLTHAALQGVDAEPERATTNSSTPAPDASNGGTRL
jgi:formate hydrogenlyase subunit 3/multisubunit Na+/H+ antiporter MnhD subunit